MKEKVKNCRVLLNVWRMLIPIYVYVTDEKFRDQINEDVERLRAGNPSIVPSTWGLQKALVRVPIFRAVFFYRMKKHPILREIERKLLPVKTPIEISGNIEGGFTVYHGHSSVIHCENAGKNFSVYQNVTVGRNKEHYSNSGAAKPVIGDNVSLYPGCVVAGGIVIGNNVEIAANSVVLNDVPDNCTVVGNPARIVRIGGKKVDIALKNYRGGAKYRINMFFNRRYLIRNKYRYCLTA